MSLADSLAQGPDYTLGRDKINHILAQLDPAEAKAVRAAIDKSDGNNWPASGIARNLAKAGHPISEASIKRTRIKWGIE